MLEGPGRALEEQRAAASQGFSAGWDMALEEGLKCGCAEF